MDKIIFLCYLTIMSICDNILSFNFFRRRCILMQKFHRSRHQLQPSMTVNQMIVLISDGKPATINFLLHLRKQMDEFDFVIILSKFDSIGLTGSNITRLFYDYCHSNVETYKKVIYSLNDTNSLTHVLRYLGITHA